MAMVNNWRMSTFNGALLAAYFMTAWTIAAFHIIVSPVHGFFERPNIAVAVFISDHFQLGGPAMIRAAWLLALGKLTVVAFFGLFVVLTTRATIRRTGGCDEALALALTIGGLISFASMLMASKVGEIEALRLHATELLLMLGTAALMAMEPPVTHAKEFREPSVEAPSGLTAGYGGAEPRAA